jgi:hypothetical protein
MVQITQRNKKFYSEEGFAALETRLKTLIRLFNENKFPFSNIMLGFGKLSINSLEECYCRILEIADLTGAQIKETRTIEEGKMEVKLEY